MFRFIAPGKTRSGEPHGSSTRRIGRDGRLVAMAIGAILAAGLMAPQAAHAGTPCSNAKLVSNPAAGTVTKGTAVHFTASATCGGTPQYLWWLSANGGNWAQQGSYSTNNTFTWDTTSVALGNYQVAFWVENQGGPADSKDTGIGSPVLTVVAPSAPKPANLVLSPNGTWYSYKYHHEENDPTYCFQTNGYGPDITTSFPNIAVGFEHYNDPGTQPFPCWNWTDTFYRGAVQFDWKQVNNYVNAHGIKSATLTYSASQGNVYCVAEIQENSDNVAGYSPFPNVIPGGQSLTPAPKLSGSNASVDLAGVIAFGEIWGGIDPYMHFVFIGADESLSEQDNNTCNAVLGNFVLTIVPEH
jgi:hypothetical protein